MLSNTSFSTSPTKECEIYIVYSLGIKFKLYFLPPGTKPNINLIAQYKLKAHWLANCPKKYYTFVQSELETYIDIPFICRRRQERRIISKFKFALILYLCL